MNDDITARLQALELRQMALLAAVTTLAKHLPEAQADLRQLAEETQNAPVAVPDQTLKVFADTIRALLRDPGVNPWLDAAQ